MQALVHLKPLILKPCLCHMKLGIKASDAAVLWDHEHTTDKTVKVFIFGAKEWCRSIFDTRKIFVASRDLFVIDPLNLFTHKQELPQRQDSNAIRTVHISRLQLATINFSNWNAHLAIPCYSHCYFRFGTRSRFYIFRLSCTLLEDLTLHISKTSLI